MAKNTGKAVVYGFPGTAALNGAAALNVYGDSGEFSHEYQPVEIRDGENVLQGLIHPTGEIRARLLFTPRGGSGANNTIAVAKAVLPPPAEGSKVTLSGMHYGDGDWVYTGGWRVAFQKNGIATYELNILKSADGSIDLVTEAAAS